MLHIRNLTSVRDILQDIIIQHTLRMGLVCLTPYIMAGKFFYVLIFQYRVVNQRKGLIITQQMDCLCVLFAHFMSKII